MAIITFCSNETKETGQTLSLAAIASYMAIEHNYKILVVSTNFNDLSLENCFWDYDKIRNVGTMNADKNQNAGVESGIEGLIKAIESNRTSNEIVRNYSRIVLKERLDVLLSASTKSYQEYFNKIVPYYENILQIANKYYDLVFVDLSKKMPPKKAAEIIQLSDIIVMNITQRLKTINDFAQLRDNNEFYQRKNIVLLVGRYDDKSKYNIKNITRYLKEKDMISVAPYNTLFFESCSEGTIIDYILKAKNITDTSDRNVNFINEIKEINNKIIYKLKELRMKL